MSKNNLIKEKCYCDMQSAVRDQTFSRRCC